MDRGDTLRQTIARKGPLTVERAAALGRRIAEAISELHAAESGAGSDLDPDTVRIWFDENGVPSAVLPRAAGGERARPADDVPRLGALLYELLAGFPPPRLGPPPPVERARPEVPELLAQLVMQCFEPDPGASGGLRSAADIARRLAPFESDASSYLPSDPRLEPGEWTQRVVPDGSLTKRISPALLVPPPLERIPPPASEPAATPAARPPEPPPAVSRSGRVLAGPLAPDRTSPAASTAPSQPEDPADSDLDDGWERPVERTQPIEIPPEFRTLHAVDAPRRPPTVYTRTKTVQDEPPQAPAAPEVPVPVLVQGVPPPFPARPLEDRTFARDLTGESGVGAVPVGADPEETIAVLSAPAPLHSSSPPPPPPPLSAAVESKRPPRPAAVWGVAAVIAAGVVAVLWIGIRATIAKPSPEAAAPRIAAGPTNAGARSAPSPEPGTTTPSLPSDSVVVVPTPLIPAGMPASGALSAPTAGPANGTAGAISSPAAPVPAPSMSPASPRAQDEQQIREAIDAWIESANAGDINGHMRFYMPRVATFYLSRDVSRDAVWTEKSRQLEGRFEMHASRPEIQLEGNGERATVVFRKRTVITDRNGSERRGDVLQEMRWVRTPRGWRIAGEREK